MQGRQRLVFKINCVCVLIQRCFRIMVYIGKYFIKKLMLYKAEHGCPSDATWVCENLRALGIAP